MFVIFYVSHRLLSVIPGWFLDSVDMPPRADLNNATLQTA